MIRVGVVGYGYWGPNLVQCFRQLDGAAVTAIADLNPARLALAQKAHPDVAHITRDALDLIRSPHVDAVIVATHIATHFELAVAAIDAGKHVLVGKPMTTSVAQADRLVERAAAAGVVLMVDHTCVYTGAVRLIGDLFRCGQLGRLTTYDSVRVNLGALQRDANVLWDLAVHDLAIMDFVLGETPVEVSATGVATFEGWPVNTAYLSARFESGVSAHCHVSWLAPAKQRRTTLVGDQTMLVYDELSEGAQVTVADVGVSVGALPVEYRRGAVQSYPDDPTEPLRVEAAEFVDAIRQGRPPLTDGVAARRVIGVLEAADLSLRNGGAPIRVSRLDDAQIHRQKFPGRR